MGTNKILEKRSIDTTQNDTNGAKYRQKVLAKSTKSVMEKGGEKNDDIEALATTGKSTRPRFEVKPNVFRCEKPKKRKPKKEKNEKPTQKPTRKSRRKPTRKPKRKVKRKPTRNPTQKPTQKKKRTKKKKKEGE